MNAMLRSLCKEQIEQLMAGVDYNNGRDKMRTNGPEPREISKLLCKQAKTFRSTKMQTSHKVF